jgi:WD40 repeat protein
MRITSACALLALAACLASTGEGAAPPAGPATTDAAGDPLPKGAFARLGSVRFRLNGAVHRSVCLSPDGKLIAVYVKGRGRPRISLIDSTTGRETGSIAAADNLVGSTLTFTPDGKELAVASYNLENPLGKAPVVFYDVAQAKESRRFKIQCGPPDVLALSPDGSVLAARERDDFRPTPLVVHEVKSGKLLARVDSIHNAQIHVSLSPDNKYLATCGTAYFRGRDKRDEENKKIASTVQLWDLKTGKEHKRLEMAGEVSAIAFSPDRKTLAVSLRGQLQLWDFAKGKRLETRRGPSEGVRRTDLLRRRQAPRAVVHR